MNVSDLLVQLNDYSENQFVGINHFVQLALRYRQDAKQMESTTSWLCRWKADGKTNIELETGMITWHHLGLI